MITLTEITMRLINVELPKPDQCGSVYERFTWPLIERLVCPLETCRNRQDAVQAEQAQRREVEAAFLNEEMQESSSFGI